MNEISQFLCYGLIDPRDNELRYVGKSAAGLKRPEEHLSPGARKGNRPINIWLQNLWNNKQIPIILILKECSSEIEALAQEVVLIALFKQAEFNLTNVTSGGQGIKGHHHSKETCAVISAAKKGKKRSPEVCAILSAAHMGIKYNKGKKRKPFTLEHRANISAAKKGKKLSPEACANMSAGQKGNKNHLGYHHSEATRSAISAAKKGKKLSPEACANMSAGQKGKPKSPKHIAAIIAAKKLYWKNKHTENQNVLINS